MVFQNKEAGKFINSNFVTLKVVKKEGESPELKKKFNIPGYPTVILLNNSGEEIDRLVGFGGKKDEYLQTIRDYAAEKNTLAQLLQQYQADTLNVKFNYALAKKHDDRFESEEAEKNIRKILKLDPKDEFGFGEESKFHVAVHEARLNRNVAPLRDFVIGSKNKDYLAKGYFYLIRHYRNEKDTARVFEIYEKAITNLPTDAGMMNQYAWAIYEDKIKEKYDKGIVLAKKAVELEPKADWIWDTLGWLYFENGDIENAVKAMEKAVNLAPESEQYKKNLVKFKSSAQS